MWDEIDISDPHFFELGDAIIMHASSGGLFAFRVLDVKGRGLIVCGAKRWRWKRLLYKIHQTWRILLDGLTHALSVWGLAEWEGNDV